MVQEFAGRGDLFEDLKRGGSNLKEEQAVREVVAPFLTCLQYLHNQVSQGGHEAARRHCTCITLHETAGVAPAWPAWGGLQTGRVRDAAPGHVWPRAALG